MKLIVGLGNPGEKYAKTRHNVGFMVIEELARKFSIFNFQFSIDKKAKAEVLKCQHGKEDFVLVKPQTMMNASGESVSKLLSFYHLPVSDLWVIHDDLDLPTGRLKIVLNRGSAGHHGIDSIVSELKTANFVRFRLGIGFSGKIDERENRRKVEDFVLRDLKGKEAVEMAKGIDKTVKAVEIALKEGIDKAMNRLNG